MKRKALLILFCFSVFLSHQLMAQTGLPKASTADKPVWYYIQVKGTDVRKDRVFYLNGSDVYGNPLSSVTNSLRSRYLWRIEKSGDEYAIINKANNKKLDIRTDATKNADILAVATGEPSVTWSFVPRNDRFMIKSNTNRYAVQGAAGSNLNFVILASTYGSTDNGSYSFILYDESEPEISDTKDIWYYINSAQSGNTNKCITDINEIGSGNVKFKIQDKESNAEKAIYQQWKVIKPVNSSDNNVFFVNRGTGNIIQTAYDYNGYFNAQSTKDTESTNGWALTFIDFIQFKISGLDSAGLTGYLNASSTTEDAEMIPGNNEFTNSAFAWTFEQVTETSIDPVTPDPFDEFKVTVINKRIFVEGTDDYFITHISGIPVKKDVELPTGVYLVTIEGKTKSYLVK